ncbi:acyl-CoA dehydrogenase [Actinomadura rubrisoli]|uniref:Acyl-CoA oxidase C-terminal domain-containing protein n=1 Tax=Actinomadura rubrisoli TaxID=2530368 RepID=A0A4R5CDR6_9ACTN|nr:acyl-CoA dehydrogenase [Actinomadura rubrisoli]TDD96450.1 hypothetical protein E1298_03140 [Actinomadura rubrisoli]
MTTDSDSALAARQTTIDALETALAGPRLPHDSAHLARILTADIYRDDDRSDSYRRTYAQLTELVRALPPATELFTRRAGLLSVSEWTAVADPSLCLAVLIHYGLCLGTLLEFENEDPAVVAHRKAMESGDKFGAFMVTEIGYGNSSLAVRTQAVYDPETREFVLHTPDVDAVKFTNAAGSDLPKLGVLFARLMVGGTDRGVFPFVFDLSDAAGPRPGVRLSAPAEIPLVSFDYGLVSLNDVRVPNSAWLRDTASIDDSGMFHDPFGDRDRRLQRTLAPVQNVWAMVSTSLAAVARASVAHALAFAAHRPMMSRLTPGEPLLRYRLLRRSLMAALATSWVSTCAANAAGRAWTQSPAVPVPTGTEPGAKTWGPWGASSQMFGAIKAMTTWAAEEVTATSRLRCGVAGCLTRNRFLHHQGLGLVCNAAAGDNLLIVLDAARALVADAEQESPRPQDRSGAAFALEDPRLWLELAGIRQNRLAASISNDATGRLLQGRDAFDTWDPLAGRLRELGVAYGLHLAIDSTVAVLDAVHDAQAATILRNLTAVYALDQIDRHAAWLISEDLLDVDDYRRIESSIMHLCDALAEHCDVLTEAFGYPGGVTRAPIGRTPYAPALASSLAWTCGDDPRSSSSASVQ